MTYSIQIGEYKILFSDSHFEYCRKKPTISVYDKNENRETKIASFNSKDTFEWFVKLMCEERKRADCAESAEEHVYVPNGDRFKPYAERSVAEVRKGTNDRDNT